jgi:RNA polymerase sigma factor (sigma-70 family)
VERAHAADLELARRCAAGDEQAWLRFMHEYRPVLYRAADALDRTGGARELADALYADLYGLRSADGDARSLFRYFQGRSSLATWLRAVLAQRYVDRVRAERRLEPLPEAPRGDAADALGAARPEAPDPDRPRYLALMRQVLGCALAALSDRDRLRLGSYYVQELTLAETGRVLKEHEATVSRQIARTRLAIREAVERRLRESGLGGDQIAACFLSVAGDPGPLDLEELFGARRDAGESANEPATERSV